VTLGPQAGPQELFLSTPADIAIMGGSVFGGKTWALVYDPLRHVDVPGFTFALFRRVMPEVTNPGGIWDEARGLYPLVDGIAREQTHEWFFPRGAKGKFAALQYEQDVEAWKSSQICGIYFDQLETFTARQFWYMLSRNRSMCGVRPYIRGSCNPDPDSFVADLVAWWIDQDSGYALQERSGVVRWFIRVNDDLVWSTVVCGAEDYERYPEFEAAAKAELAEHHPELAQYARSLTFVLARLQDNTIGRELDPEYEARIRAMPLVEQERLLGGDRGGNWKIRHAAGLVFNRAWFATVDAPPAEAERCRGWDKAGTSGGGDWTVGVKMSRTPPDPVGLRTYYVEDVERGQWGAGDRERVIDQKAEADGAGTIIRVEQEPAAGGKESAEATVGRLSGYDVRAIPATTNLVQRANPLAAQAQVGNVKLVRGPWNEAFLRELHAFPTTGVPDDQVSAAAVAFRGLVEHDTELGMLDYYAQQARALTAATTGAH
jgi:predicted phage terminase large subunit-like protein